MKNDELQKLKELCEKDIVCKDTACDTTNYRCVPCRWREVIGEEAYTSIPKLIAEIERLQKRVGQVLEVTRIQRQQDMSEPYMAGLTNGLAVAESILTESPAVFMEKLK